jgi:tRNA threonylcarbamoyladenosine biosynthesis protein TsaB
LSQTLVLGIETSGASTGLALVASGKVVSETVERSDCGHNEVLMPLLDRLLRDAGVAARDLDGIGVDIGPGMFTSLRVGTSTAKGLAVAHQIPVVGLGSLWGLARTARPTLDGVLAVIDARKGQLYAALYLEGGPTIPPSVMDPEELLSAAKPMLQHRGAIAVAGNGADTVIRLSAAAGIRLESARIETPSPGVVALEAGERIARGLADDLATIEPRYLRRTDAELTRDRKLAAKH